METSKEMMVNSKWGVLVTEGKKKRTPAWEEGEEALEILLEGVMSKVKFESRVGLQAKMSTQGD